MAARRRFLAPPRAGLPPARFAAPPFDAWAEYGDLLRSAEFPGVAALNARRAPGTDWRFVPQTAQLLADGLHYEARIADCGAIATRADNWHDLFNALVWLRYPALKAALNARQVAEIARMGPKARSRAQCALTHFDEAGVVVRVRDARLLALWDAHDWHGLFWRERTAWGDGRIDLALFGHALLEHALAPHQLLVAKALVCADAPRVHAPAGAPPAPMASVFDGVAAAVAAGALLRDPQELRPLPLSGLPGWHADNAGEGFYRSAACFRPLRPGRVYPAPWPLPSAARAAAGQPSGGPS